MTNELSIPPEALAHPSVEMIRVWLANQKQHVAFNIGFWEDRGINEREAWGILLADMVRHIADAHESEYGHDSRETILMIRQSFEAEMNQPTSDRMGEFINERRGQENTQSEP